MAVWLAANLCSVGFFSLSPRVRMYTYKFGGYPPREGMISFVEIRKILVSQHVTIKYIRLVSDIDLCLTVR